MNAESGRRVPARIDWALICSAAALLLAGLLSLYSIDHARGTDHFSRQLLYAALGIVPLVALWKIPLSALQAGWRWLYALNALVLAFVLVAGSSGGGATRWIELGPLTFQPSEASKLLLILTLSAFFAANWSVRKRFSTFAISLLHTAPIALLVFMQPHLGAAIGLFAIWIAICIAGGVPWRLMAGAAVAAAGLVAIAFAVPGALKDYQRERIASIIKPDRTEDAYQQWRARIAFGAGGVMGAGFLQGRQKAGGYIPEQQNDFIFTVVGEEAGLFGAGLVIVLFGVFLARAWRIAYAAPDPFARLAGTGILAILGFHTVVNLAMNLQLLPVVGLWLPFMSAGGTALWLCMACVGLLLNIRSQEQADWLRSDPRGYTWD